MKQIYFLASTLTIFFNLNKLEAQTLNAGDIAIIGINEDSGPTSGQDHSFTFIALKGIPAGEVIFFTEQGWNNNNTGTTSGFWMGNTEGHFSWTAPVGGVACGTIVRIYETGTDVLNTEGGGTCSSILSGTSWNLSGGDQVIAYYSASGARPVGTIPTFITAMHMDDSRSTSIGYDPITTWSSAGYADSGSAASHVPPGLTNGTNCIALFNPTNTLYFENDNVKYNGTLTGTSETIRTAIFKSIENGGTWEKSQGPSWDITPSAYTANVDCATLSTNTFFLDNKTKIYPNPSNGIIKVIGFKINETYSIYNILGNKVLEGKITNNKTIDINVLSKGMYFLKVVNKIPVKFLKE